MKFINKGDSLSRIQKIESKQKDKFRQMVTLGILLLGVILVLLTGFYLKTKI